MTLRRQLVLTSLLLALPVALAVTWTVGAMRDRDREQALFRVADGHLTDIVRDACLEDPNWFLAGPRTGRPSAAARAMPDADVYLPRPATDELPFEVFAYDRQYQPSSSAAPRFPDELRQALRGQQTGAVSSRYPSRTGEGHQVAMLTGWSSGPCAILLFRLRPEAGTSTRALLIFGGTYLLAFLAAALTMLPAEVRMRKMAAAARASAREKYTSIVPIGGRDEISAMGAAFNEAAADLRRRTVDVRDRENALQRHVTHTTEDVAVPLSALEQRLAALDAGPVLSPPVRTELRGALREAHHLVSRLNNLAAVTRLRTSAERLAREPVDFGAIVERVVATRSAVARVEGVDVNASIPSEPVTWPGDPALCEQMVANVVDNAVMHNRAGGRVEIELKGYEGGRLTLRVTDDGPGVTDDAFAELTANRRFRGDEGRSGRGGRGLGLAVAREVADRFGLQLDLRRPATGGFEVEFSVR